MGLYDRGYYQEEGRGVGLGGRSLVIQLILLNFSIWVADLLTSGQLTAWFALRSDLPDHLWQFYQLVSYGFLHDREYVIHILLNMFWLWMFGMELETIYGKAEFLRFYLMTIVMAGLIWVAVQASRGVPSVMVGASGGIMGLMILYVLQFPRRMFYIWGILPMPAWMLGVVYVASDILGAASSSDNVAHVAHLSGVAFGFLYYQFGWNLGRLAPRRLRWPSLRPRLRVHRPESESRQLADEVDRILEKISRSGEASLTRQERQTLERASRKYQQRRG